MSEFKWRHFEGEIILWAVRWYCRYGISYRGLEQMMGERGVGVAYFLQQSSPRSAYAMLQGVMPQRSSVKRSSSRLLDVREADSFSDARRPSLQSQQSHIYHLNFAQARTSEPCTHKRSPCRSISRTKANLTL